MLVRKEEHHAKSIRMPPTKSISPRIVDRIQIVFHIGYTMSKEQSKKDTDLILSRINLDFNLSTNALFNSKAFKEKYKNTEVDYLYRYQCSKAGDPQIEYETHAIHYFDTMNTIRHQYIKDDGLRLKTVVSPIVDPLRYLNIWIVPEITDGIYGFSTLPWCNESFLDGIVVSVDGAGLNKHADFVLTHEIGHWLGLYHTFTHNEELYDPIVDSDGDGIFTQEENTGDYIKDTPYQEKPYQLTSFPEPTYKAWPSCTDENGDTHYMMFMNHMSYSTSNISIFFTKEQCVRMRDMLRIYRPLTLL